MWHDTPAFVHLIYFDNTNYGSEYLAWSRSVQRYYPPPKLSPSSPICSSIPPPRTIGLITVLCKTSSKLSFNPIQQATFNIDSTTQTTTTTTALSIPQNTQTHSPTPQHTHEPTPTPQRTHTPPTSNHPTLTLPPQPNPIQSHQKPKTTTTKNVLPLQLPAPTILGRKDRRRRNRGGDGFGYV